MNLRLFRALMDISHCVASALVSKVLVYTITQSFAFLVDLLPELLCLNSLSSKSAV
jgi:hypothetical protein